MRDRDLELIASVAAEAGKIAQGFWSGENEVWEKGPDDPVSQADFAVDTFLRDTLLAARPEYGWLSEETTDTPDRRTKNTVFVVDPIDGTRSFVAGRTTWAISIGIVADGLPVAGVVALPMRDKTYTAQAGKGSDLTNLSQARVLANKAALSDRYWRQSPKVAETAFRPSLAYRLCLVAEGRFDAMLTFRESWEWDIAAGAVIAAEAGAIVTDRNGRQATFNSPNAQVAGMIVAAPGIQRDLINRRASEP